jgi:hypothetical protein
MNAFIAGNIGQILLDKISECVEIENMMFACGVIGRYAVHSWHKI